MKKSFVIILVALFAISLAVSVFATIPLGQASDSAYGYTMNSSVSKTRSSASMSGSGVDLYVSLSCNIYYTDGTYSPGHDSCCYPDESVPDAIATLNTHKTFSITYGSNSFQPYDDYSVPTHGTYLAYTE